MSDVTTIAGLILDDDPEDIFLLRDMLADAGATDIVLDEARTLAEARQSICSRRYDVLLVDLNVPDSSGIETFLEVHRSAPEVPIIVLSGLHDETLAVEAVRKGAQDYLVKGRVDGGLLTRAIQYSIERNELLSELRQLRRQQEAAYQASLRDVEAQKALVEELAKAKQTATHMALHDSLTGLPNLRYFQKQLSAALVSADRAKCSAGILCFDLDGFKRINDTFGHDVGDLVLETVARRVQSSLRETDRIGRCCVTEIPTVSRLGGDEFTIVAARIRGRGDLERIARRVRAAIAKPFEIAEAPIGLLTASIGITVYPDDAQSPAALLKNADLAMYAAKRQGRNNIQFFTEDLDTEIQDRRAVEGALVGALERDEFELHYQPIFEIETGRLEAVEALMRWQHPTLGDVRPDRFISVAEERGLIGALGEWALRTACAQSRTWRDQGWGEVCVAVNVSAIQLRRPHFADLVHTVLDENGSSANSLQLELTESLMMEDLEVTEETLRRLRTLGVHVALDDFGTGYSSLSYLHRIKPDILKIDRSFIRDIDTDAERRGVVDAILAMARALHLRVIAEGVERRSQLEYLRSRGCHAAQGFLLGRPGCGSLIEAVLRSSSRNHLPRADAA